ncbi:putative alkaline shock family protein YloU [Georgenia soli]|uniref:Putative alkaline shock family protein YloU n=1 Tax=Georgenia soli TaxID=638953 RepID=A0A2A9EJE6_9MICO|nr:Asp23/Gls24 family envelope stress response protein [Georgenia soli]PFG38943.1 putative alkaline shock family protein YloU [Georgenia soli]
MTTDTLPGPAGATAQRTGGSLPDPADRGELRVADRVVERVAGYAVTLVPDAAAAPRRVLGVKVGDADTEEAANVTAHVYGTTASIEVIIAVRWPAPVPTVVGEVRRRIREEVTGITGVRVDHIDIDVAGTDIPTAARPRVR